MQEKSHVAHPFLDIRFIHSFLLQMTLEAVVNGKGDYVLIDKITVRTWEPSTSSRPTSSSTTDAPTTDAPKSGQDALVPVGVSSMTFMFLFAFTVFVRDQLFSYNL